MAYEYTVITYGGGKILTEIFNGIAAAMGTHAYMTVMGIAAFFALTWILIETTFKQNLQISIQWFVVFFLMYNLLLVPKVTVNIRDRVNPTEVNIIQNVPWGLAEFSSVVTQLFDSLTRQAEKVYALPDDLKYTKTGALMASSLIQAANRFVITDPKFANNVDHFMQQCVFYDLLLGKYSTQDLFNTSNLWGFMTANASPARAFKYNKTIVTCRQGAQALTRDWQAQLRQAGRIYGTRFFNSVNAQAASQQLLTYLPIAYGYLGEVSQGAQQLMQQNMVKNAIEQAVIGHAGEVNADAALRTYAFARAQQTKRSLYQVAGLQAGYWLPIMKIVFEAILFGAFLFLAPLWLLPPGVHLFRLYLMTLIWVESWSPLYAILNLVMTYSAKLSSASATIVGSSHVLTMMTLPGLVQANQDISVLAGYLTLSIPVIAQMIVRGGVMSLMTLSQYIGGAAQSAAAHAVQEETTGNLSFGNTNFDNHSAFNTNANHFDTNARVFSGAVSTQMPGGSSLTITPSGSEVLDNRGAISSLGTTVNLADTMRETLTQQADKAWTNTYNEAKSYSESMSSAIRQLDDLGASQSQSQASGESSNFSEQAGLQSSASSVYQLTQRFAQTHGISHQASERLLEGAYLNAHLGIKGNHSFAAKIAGFLTGVDGGFSAGAKGEWDHSSQTSHQALWDEAKQYVHNSNYDEALNDSIRAVKDHSYRTSDEATTRYATNIGSALDKAETARADMSAQYQKAESYRDMANYAHDNALSINANASQSFVNWMKDQAAPGSQGPMGMDSVEYIMANRPELAQDYAARWSQQEAKNFMQNFASQTQRASAQTMQSSYKTQASQIPGQAAVSQYEQANQQDIMKPAVTKSVGEHHAIDTSAQQTTRTVLSSIHKHIDAKGSELKQGAHEMSQANQHKLKE